jgi:hypothetical protein
LEAIESYEDIETFNEDIELINNKISSVNETIELAKHIENAHIDTKKLNKKDDSIDNSSLCMNDNMKQDQEPTCNNSNNNNCSNINNSSTC